MTFRPVNLSVGQKNTAQLQVQIYFRTSLISAAIVARRVSDGVRDCSRY